MLWLELLRLLLALLVVKTEVVQRRFLFAAGVVSAVVATFGRGSSAVDVVLLSPDRASSGSVVDVGHLERGKVEESSHGYRAVTKYGQ